MLGYHSVLMISQTHRNKHMCAHTPKKLLTNLHIFIKNVQAFKFWTSDFDQLSDYKLTPFLRRKTETERVYSTKDLFLHKLKFEKKSNFLQ